jgi:hypothetical protein
MNRHVPGGWRPDHSTPEKFVIRCSDCGRLSLTEDRGDAHDRADSHALTCEQAGVTPISPLEEDDLDDEEERPTLAPSLTDLDGEEVTVVYRSNRSGRLQERDAVVEEMLDSNHDVPYRGFLAEASNGILLEIDLLAAVVFSHGNVRSPTGEFVRVEPTCEDPALVENATEDARVATDGGEA